MTACYLDGVLLHSFILVAATTGMIVAGIVLATVLRRLV